MTAVVVVVAGLTADSEHSVTVSAVEPNKNDKSDDTDDNSVTTSFFTLREGLVRWLFLPLSRIKQENELKH